MTVGPVADWSLAFAVMISVARAVAVLAVECGGARSVVAVGGHCLHRGMQGQNQCLESYVSCSAAISFVT